MKSYCHIYGQLGQTGAGFCDELEHLLHLGLVCDTDFNLDLPGSQRDGLAELQRRGGAIAPNLYPATLDPACRDANWWKYSEVECLRLLRLAQGRYAALDLGPLEAVNTYTPGNGFVAACRRLGIRYILGFCAPTVIEDGGWSISHYGSPLSPYFIADDDYRKPEDPGARADAVMMLSMELRNPLVCLRHWSEGPWCPLNAQAADRWLEPTAEPLPFLQIAEDWLRQTELAGRPLFFHINLQYFFAGRCREHNRRALEWLAEQRDKGRLEIGGIRPWAERMRAGGGFVRQTTYWRGEMMGFHVGHRPGCMPDIVVDEHLGGQGIWEWPHATPRRWYDFQTPWSYPAFAPQGDAPASAEFADVTVAAQTLHDEGASRMVALTIRNPGPARRVPLAIWDVLTGLAGPFTVEVSAGWEAEAVPHPAGTGGMLLLTGDCPAGESQLCLGVRGAACAPERCHRQWGHLIAAQSFTLRHEPYTYLVTQAPERFAVTVRSPVRRVRVESLCGIDYEVRDLPANGLPLMFDGTRLACWHRLWGVHADEIEIDGVAAAEAELRQRTAERLAPVAPDLRVPEPGYQLFGNIRDTSRWDRVVGRAAGEDERRRVNSWFRDLRPGAGQVVVEVHPGLYLPRGSITKVLGHEFDEVECAYGYGFKELCADYPQGWDWGVAAWVQWRHLRVQVEGLGWEEGTYSLHLGAFDPESRDISLRVHFFEPGSRDLELCAVTAWNLPQGIEGRWSATALCSVPIPEACLRWSALGIWLCPLEKMKLYDWVAEKGAPGLLSHLWVTRR